jgi:hypothetical protein
MSKAAPGPYQTVDVGNGTNGFHTYIIDRNKRKIGVAWGPKEEKVWTAALWAAAPELLEALKGVLAVADRKTDEFDAARAAIAKATGTN